MGGNKKHRYERCAGAIALNRGMKIVHLVTYILAVSVGRERGLVHPGQGWLRLETASGKRKYGFWEPMFGETGVRLSSAAHGRCVRCNFAVVVWLSCLC